MPPTVDHHSVAVNRRAPDGAAAAGVTAPGAEQQGMRRLVVPVLIAVLAALAVPSAAAPKPAPAGERLHGTYPGAGVPGARAYALYVPAAVKAKPRKAVPLLVYLHGCNQTADDVAVGTRLEQLAEEKGLLVLFPEQLRPVGSYPVADGNGSGCWNWFHPDHQTRDAGEPRTLAGMTRDVMSRFAVDQRRVWLAGASAGADMATTLAAAYPELYAAVAPIAGCAYRSCSDGDGTAALAQMGPRARVVPTLVVQGSADMVNNAGMGATAVQQWVATNDLADDGTANGSVPQQPSSVTSYDAVQGTPPGDPCVGNSRLPCAGGAAGLKSYPYSVARYDDGSGRSVVEAWVIHGANHAYTGGDPRGTFVDPVGPDLAHAMHAFFVAHPRA
jgi:poly(hydroxyalkanoate) depolymerase family esterase